MLHDPPYGVEHELELPPFLSRGLEILQLRQSIQREIMQGLHKNAGKLRLDLIPPEAIEGMALVLGKACEGSDAKYPERNWEKGLDWGATCASVERHLLAFRKGEDIDPEFGALHLEHAMTRLAMLLAMVKRGVGKDDRPVQRPAPAPEYEPQSGDWVRIKQVWTSDGRINLFSLFKVGELVQIVAAARATATHPAGAWMLRSRSNCCFWASIEKAEAPEYVPQPGDWVKITRILESNTFFSEGFKVGDVVEIRKALREVGYFHRYGKWVLTSKDERLFWADVEKAETSPAPEYVPQKGDYVRVTRILEGDRFYSEGFEVGDVVKIDRAVRAQPNHRAGKWVLTCGDKTFWADVEKATYAEIDHASATGRLTPKRPGWQNSGIDWYSVPPQGRLYRGDLASVQIDGKLLEPAPEATWTVVNNLGYFP